jgi:hypothetical protein
MSFLLQMLQYAQEVPKPQANALSRVLPPANCKLPPIPHLQKLENEYQQRTVAVDEIKRSLGLLKM